MRNLGALAHNGFTLIEILVAVSLLALIGVSMLSVYLTGERLMKQGLSLAKAQSLSRVGMEKIDRNLRMAQSATVLAGGDQLTFVVDLNANPYSPNLVTRRLTFSLGADGSEAQANDNQITYDPNVLVGGDEEVLLQNVRRLPGQNIFGVNGKMVSVNLRVVDVLDSYLSPTYAGSEVRVSTDVYMRN